MLDETSMRCSMRLSPRIMQLAVVRIRLCLARICNVVKPDSRHIQYGCVGTLTGGVANLASQCAGIYARSRVPVALDWRLVL